MKRNKIIRIQARGNDGKYKPHCDICDQEVEQLIDFCLQADGQPGTWICEECLREGLWKLVERES